MSKIIKIKLNSRQKKIRRRILEIINAGHTSHIGSCISVVDIIDTIYSIKTNDEKFVLSNGHSAVALYAVLEKYGLIKNPSLDNLSTHPDREVKNRIDVSTGSLGQGLPIALGIALADRTKKVYCITSDGECAEGSIWESLRVAYEQKVYNLKIIVSANGWGAYDSISISSLEKRLKGFGFSLTKINGHNPLEIKNALKEDSKRSLKIIFAETSSEQLPFLNGLDAHYHIMNKEDFALAMEILK